MNVLVMISYIHIYVCLYEMCFDKWFHVVRVSGLSGARHKTIVKYYLVVVDSSKKNQKTKRNK